MSEGKSMNLPLNVDVHCSDGRCGRSAYVIINPATEQITHLVIKESQPPRTERLVPVSRITQTTPDVILLNCSRAELADLEPFEQTDFVYTDVPHYATDPKLTLLWPYVVPSKQVIDDTYRRMAPEELALKRGTRVHATDGRVGRVDEFLVDPDSGQITHLIMREGHLWQRDVAIPVSHIARIEEGAVHVKYSKKEIEELPSIPVSRRW